MIKIIEKSIISKDPPLNTNVLWIDTETNTFHRYQDGMWVPISKEDIDPIETKLDELEETLNQKANAEDIPTKVSELENDKNYLTQHQDVSGKADQTYVDAKLATKLDDAPQNSKQYVRQNGTWQEVEHPTIVDNLTSTASTSVLSANMGRELNEKITDIQETANTAKELAEDSNSKVTLAQQAAQTASDHITSLEQAIQNLPDGAAVSEQVAENTTAISQKADTHKLNVVWNEAPSNAQKDVLASTFFCYQAISPSLVGKKVTGYQVYLGAGGSGLFTSGLCTINTPYPTYTTQRSYFAYKQFEVSEYRVGTYVNIVLDKPVEVPENAYIFVRAADVEGNPKILPIVKADNEKVYRCYYSDSWGDDGYQQPFIYNNWALNVKIFYDTEVALGVGGIYRFDVNCSPEDINIVYNDIVDRPKTAVLPKATPTEAGVMSALDKSILDELNGGVVAGIPTSNAFKAEVEDTIEKVKTVLDGASLSLLLISDPHERITNAQYVRRMNSTFNNMKAVAKGVKVDGAVSLGDIFWSTIGNGSEGYAYYTDQDVCNAHFKSYSDRFSQVHEHVYMLIGNHDGIGASFNSNTVTAMYSYMQKYMEGYTERNADSLYFWFDRPDIKTRCICLASPDQDDSYRWMSPKQLRWLANTALDVEDGWNVLVFCHTRPDVGDIILKDTLFGIVNAFGKHEAYHDNYIDVDYTKYESVKMVAWICGHQHYDRVQYRDDFVCPIIYIPSPNPAVIGSGTLPEGATNPPKNYTEGTLGADCWDVLTFRPDQGKIYLTRFGAGDDRIVDVDCNTISYDAKRLSLESLNTVINNNIGDITQLQTVDKSNIVNAINELTAVVTRLRNCVLSNTNII